MIVRRVFGYRVAFATKAPLSAPELAKTGVLRVNSRAVAAGGPNPATTPGTIGSNHPPSCASANTRERCGRLTTTRGAAFASPSSALSASRASYGRDIRSITFSAACARWRSRDLCNVWPEPKSEAKRNDEVENALVVAVCYRHTLTLQAAQSANRARLTAITAGLPAIWDHHYEEHP
jgi:hypothetical protein